MTERLRERVTLLAFAPSEDLGGGYDRRWIPGRAVYARIRGVSASDRSRELGARLRRRHEITIRYTDNIGPQDRLRFNNGDWCIKDMYELESPRRTLRLVVEEVL